MSRKGRAVEIIRRQQPFARKLANMPNSLRIGAAGDTKLGVTKLWGNNLLCGAPKVDELGEDGKVRNLVAHAPFVTLSKL